MAKKIIAWLLVVVLTAGVAIGGTLAYLTDRDSEANVFTVGDVNIDLNEDFIQGSTLVPGVSIEKKPTITNVGSNSAWVWSTVAVPKNMASVVEFTGTGTGWEVMNSSTSTTISNEDYVLFTILHTEVLEVGGVTNALFSNVALSPSVDVDSDGNWHTVVDGVTTDLGWDNADGDPVIYVSAYAIQAENFSTVEDAYEAYNTQWGDNGSEYAEPVEVITKNGISYVTDGDTGFVSSAGSDTIYRGVFSDNLTDLTALVINEGIIRLANRAFYVPGPLNSVTLPNSLVYMEEGAFQGSGITEIEIPENVTYMGKQSLGYCPQLETIVIKAKNVTIGNYIARACGNLREVYIYSDAVTFESGSMYFCTTENANASQITFYVSSKEIADTLYAVSSTSHSYGMLIKSLDGSITYYNTLKQ